MSELRPHWDDYLLASVMIHCSDIYQCHAVIAAVEDWQKERFKWSDIIQSPFEVAVRHNAAEERAEKAEAAIARVRALAEQASTVIARGCTCYGDDCTGKCRRGEPLGWDLNPAEVLRALDGDSDG